MKTDELREKYLAFFETKGHTRQQSDVLVPTWDPSVLFTPAGMNQFKDHFLGKVKLDFTRATTSQKCLRTGDIDNVGRTAYHHTFFEMLGNFSFGDYFKREAISWAWEFLTDPAWLALDKDRLNISVYVDDDEAAEIWHEEIGLSTSRITRMGEDDNFWPAGAPSQGPDGVCGPCSEIFYVDDTGSEVEIWNLVFTQFNRVGDPPDNLRPLPSKNIDTGMGLERTAAVLQGVDTNYHIDILRPIVETVAEVCGTEYDSTSESGRRLRRITDHLRACTFAIHENVYPGPNKEKYVIRRLLRRAVLDGHQLGLRDPFLHQLVPVVAGMMKHSYPELGETVDRVSSVIEQEENTFFATIDGGLSRIDSIFSQMEADGQLLVEGTSAAELYQTYGLPPELVESMAADRNFSFDWEGFRAAMQQHGIDSGKSQFELFKTGPVEGLKRTLQRTEFIGYEQMSAEVVVKGIVGIDEQDAAGQLVESCQTAGQQLIVITDVSPFYGESGGQVGDQGLLVGPRGRVEVSDTQQDGELLLHYGQLAEGQLDTGDTVTATVDDDSRNAIRRAHSATHILHHALQQALGSHAQQQGSKVDGDWLRFDFTHQQPVSVEELASIEAAVIEKIAAADAIQWELLSLADARSRGAMMLFGEKYPDPVRMVSMGQFSHELCGGTHLESTAEIEDFELISEEGVSAGTRRITALTGAAARENAQQVQQQASQAAQLLSVDIARLPVAASQLAGKLRDLKKQLAGSGSASPPTNPAEADTAQQLGYLQIRAALRDAARQLNVSTVDVTTRLAALQNDVKSLEDQLSQMAGSEEISADSLLESALQIGETTVVVQSLEGTNPNRMRQLIDQLKQKTGSVAALLITAMGPDKVLLVAGVSDDLIAQGAHAGQWIGEVAAVVGGSGGGKPAMAQAGGGNPDRIDDALELARQQISDLLG